MGKNGGSTNGSGDKPTAGDRDYDIHKDDPQTVKDVAEGRKDN